MDTDNSMVVAREKEGWAMGGGGQRGKVSISVIVSTIKIMLKKKNYNYLLYSYSWETCNLCKVCNQKLSK